MTIKTTYKLYTSGISSQAKAVLNAAIKYAEERKQIRLHSMLIADFCNFSGLDVNTPVPQVIKLMKQARRAIFSVEVVDVTGSKKEEITSGSWPLFSFISITKTHISFEVCCNMLEEIRQCDKL